jgi:two-component system, NtrC family, sensor histidine kinase HydH
MKTATFAALLKKSLPLLYVLAVALTILIGWVGYSTSRQIQETITRQFNQQQLTLARKISNHIQNQIAYLQSTLLGLREIRDLIDPAASGERNVFWNYRQILAGDVLSLMILDRQGRPVLKAQDPSWNPGEIPLPSPASLSAYLPSALTPNRVWVGRTFSLAGKWVLPLMAPFGPKGPSAPEVGGAVVLILDAIHIAGKATAGVVSGTTGYAWVITSQGILLDHYESTFVGRSIFEVRKARNPNISYRDIDDLTRRDLLQRKEGTSRYTSGWHRNKVTLTEKLIAYTAIPFYETPDRDLRSRPLPADEFWSVALVAPIEEVSGLIRSLNYQQFLLIGIFQMLIIVGTGMFVFISNRWSRYLAIEVDRKTEELKKSQEKLVHSERLAAVGSMASHVSHEIKNPLIAIGGMAHQLKRSPNLTDKEKDKLDLVINEIGRLENMLLEVRDFTRPTTPRKIRTSLHRLIKEITELLSDLTREQQIEVLTDLDPRVTEFSFDPDQMKQVLLNLIKNALEAMPEGGRLSVTTRREDDQAVVEISDTGQGFEKDHQTDLFRPFYTTKKKGTGLGLAVSYKIVQDHNGDIRVDSQTGRGTRVVVLLPITD